MSACLKGTVKPGDTIRLMGTGAEFQLVEVGHMGATSLTPCDKLEAGEVGYLTASIKTVRIPAWATPSPLAEPHGGSAARFPPGHAHGVLRHLPRRRRRLPRSERRAGKAAAERRLPEL